MNDRHAENALKIADYLENRLSPAAEELFVRELNEDQELCRQYEDELLIRGMLGAAGHKGEGVEGNGLEVGGLLQPADEHMHMVTEILEKGKEVRRPGAKIALFSRSGMVAAVLLVIISGTILYIRIGYKGGQHGGAAAGSVGSGHAGSGSAAPGTVAPDTGGRAMAGRGVGRNGAAVADSAYARCYTLYSGEDDPVEVSLYYRDYKKGNYAAVLAARDTDFQVLGADAKGGVVKGYMELYKGLSYLAMDKGAEAIGQLDAAAAAVEHLDGAAAASRSGEALYDAARWYAALAWLRRMDVAPGMGLEKALSIAREITHTSSRYRSRAARLIAALGG